MRIKISKSKTDAVKRDPVAESLRDARNQPQVKPSGKLYQRTRNKAAMRSILNEGKDPAGPSTRSG